MLKLRLFDDVPLDQREQILQDNCEAVKTDFEFTKPLLEEDLNARREEKVNLDIALHKQSEELREWVKDSKKRMEPLQERSRELMQVIKDRHEEAKETVYIFKDEATNMIGYYDSKGDQVFTRRMKPEEKQKSIFSDIKVTSSEGDVF